MARLLSLSDPECRDPLRAGGKAARLARAHAAGLPVLPGVVVPAAESMQALDEGLSMVVSAGVHGARLAVMDADVGRLAELPGAAAALADIVVVRSSSPLEGAGQWSGAFTSFLDVRTDEVLTAVRGVWASAVSEDALARLDHEGARCRPLGVAVLVQPLVRPRFSGTAEVGGDGHVTLVATAGSPAPLMAGWEPGLTARCEPDGSARGDAVAMVGEDLLRQVTELARSVRRELGDNHIEWADAEGAVMLLQAKTTAGPAVGCAVDAARGVSTRAGAADTAREPPAVAGAADTAREPPAGAVEVSRRGLLHAGPTGERLVLPWLLAGGSPACLPEPPQPAGPVQVDAALAAWEEAVGLARRLTREVWGHADDPAGEASATLAALRGVRADDALRLLAALPTPDAEHAARVLALLRRVAQRLVEAGAMGRADQLWALPPEAVRRALAGGGLPDPEGAARRAALRWEPFVYTAVMACGKHARGRPASPGTGAGRAVYVGGAPGRTGLPPRAVIMAPRPLPHLAPLLWGAAALVTFGGGVAAHLVEVARSLGVPAVVGCRAERLLGEADPATLVAVDGDSGTVAVHREIPCIIHDTDELTGGLMGERYG